MKFESSELMRRIVLAFTEYAKNDGKVSAAAALLTGKKVESYAVERILEEAAGIDEEMALEKVRILLKQETDPETRLVLTELFDVFGGESEKTMLVICGPSSVGKDYIATELKSMLKSEGVKLKYISKYTSRRKRGNQDNEENGGQLEPSSNYTYLSKRDFKDHDDIDIKYELYGYNYGFSIDDLVSDEHSDKNLACIYGDIDSIDYFKKQLKRKYNRRVFSILLTSDTDTLYHRLSKRGSMANVDIKTRWDVLNEQSKYIENNKEVLLSSFDIVVDNSNKNAVYYVAKSIIEEMSNQLFYTQLKELTTFK